MKCLARYSPLAIQIPIQVTLRWLGILLSQRGFGSSFTSCTSTWNPPIFVNMTTWRWDLQCSLTGHRLGTILTFMGMHLLREETVQWKTEWERYAKSSLWELVVGFGIWLDTFSPYSILISCNTSSSICSKIPLKGIDPRISSNHWESPLCLTLRY